MARKEEMQWQSGIHGMAVKKLVQDVITATFTVEMQSLEKTAVL